MVILYNKFFTNFFMIENPCKNEDDTERKTTDGDGD